MRTAIFVLSVLAYLLSFVWVFDLVRLALTGEPPRAVVEAFRQVLR